MSKPEFLRVRSERNLLHSMLMKMASRHRADERHQLELVERTLLAVPSRPDLMAEEDPEEALFRLMGTIAEEGRCGTPHPGASAER